MISETSTVVSGIFPEIGAMHPGTIITEGALAAVFKKSPVSIKRAVRRGELPKPTRLMGKCTWTAGSIIQHLEQRIGS